MSGLPSAVFATERLPPLATELNRVDALADGIQLAYARVHARCLPEPTTAAEMHPARLADP